MKTEDVTKLNTIKNKLSDSKPISANDLYWLIKILENTEFERKQIEAKYERLKNAVNGSQMDMIQADTRIRQVYRGLK